MLVALDQLINQAANVRYVSGGRHGAPLVVRTQQGATPGSCAQHSQSLEALLAHIPGLRIGVPATPQDAHSMLRAAVADDDPVVLFEARALYGRKQTVSVGGRREGVGGARVRREGGDLAILSWGRMALAAEEAASALAEAWRRGDGGRPALALATGRRCHRRSGVRYEPRVGGSRGERHRGLRRGDRGPHWRASFRRAGCAGKASRGAGRAHSPAPALQEALLPSAASIERAAKQLVSED